MNNEMKIKRSEISNSVLSIKDFHSFAIMVLKLKSIQNSIDANMLSKELSKN